MAFWDFFRKKIMADCGHLTKHKDWVRAFGCKCLTELPVENNRTAYCHRCLEKMAIKCAWCGGTIFIGDPITLYSPKDPNFQIPEQASVYSRDPLRLVGCLRWDCADTGADRAGFWYLPGKVMRARSPLEQASDSPAQVVIVSDLGDMAEATRKT